MSIGDSLLRQVEQLKKALAAVQNGLPQRIVVVTASDDPDDANRAILARLARYGLASVDELASTQSTVVVVRLPWMSGRNIRKREENDQHTKQTCLQSPELTDNDIGIMGLSETEQNSGAPTWDTSYKDGVNQ